MQVIPARSSLEQAVAGLDGVLRDIPVPGGHVVPYVAVVPSGVWALREVTWAGRALECRDAGSPQVPSPRLRVDGADWTDELDGLHAGVAELTRVLGAEVFWTEVRAALCVAGAAWPVLSRGFSVGPVKVCPPRSVQALLSRKGMLERADVTRLRARIASTLAAPTRLPRLTLPV